ncbi:MAG: ABC transporter permease [Chitinophagaceae bacterium]|nr:ABC transporter permease [Chitinophagaceae bacterium]
MIKHYFKIALRNLGKQKGLSFINIFGLSVGLACFTLFLLYAVNEFSFDRFHKNAKNIYRVYYHRDAVHGEEARSSSYLPIPLGPAMKENFPEVEDFVRIKDSWDQVFVKADNKVSRSKISAADPQFFSVFSFKILYGNPVDPLKGLHDVVLTKEKALQLFGEANAVGKTIDIKIDDGFEPFTVSAVADDIPSNSTNRFDILYSFEYYMTTKGGKPGVDNWHRSGYQTYVVLRPGSKLERGSQQLRNFRSRYYAEDEASMKKDSSWTAQGSPSTFGLQPLNEMHTDLSIGGGTIEAVNPKNIWILLAIAAGVLLIACINFTTLAIGRSAGRAKEVGVRKVIGSGKRQLVLQFLAEALLLSIVSAVVGFLLSNFLLPYFNQLSGRELSFSFAHFPEMIWMLIGLVLLVGLLTGSYPALVLSSFKTIEVLKSKVRVGGSNIFTKSLVTVQFVLSIGLIISTVIILQQLKFMQDKYPGFNKENIVMVDAEGTDTRKIYPLFKQSLSAQPQIIGVAGSELGLGEGTGWSQSAWGYNGKQKNAYEYFVDNDYIKLMGIEIVAGRNFDPKIASDTQTSVIINEAMVKDFGWTDDEAVGKELTGYQETLTPVVIGVVKNFNFRPFSEKVEPQMFHQFQSYAPYKYFVRIKPGDPAAALEIMKKSWAGVVPALPFKYEFLDESLDRFYKSESRWSSIVGWAGGISIFLACLGLFGLAALAAVNRTKEIGIRKVLGAGIPGIIGLLSKDFLKLVTIAIIIAIPLAWYFMHNWLQDFAYRINIGWWVFAITGVAAVLIALITISFQAIKAAIANPVKSLRTE